MEAFKQCTGERVPFFFRPFCLAIIPSPVNVLVLGTVFRDQDAFVVVRQQNLYHLRSMFGKSKSLNGKQCKDYEDGMP